MMQKNYVVYRQLVDVVVRGLNNELCDNLVERFLY